MESCKSESLCVTFCFELRESISKAFVKDFSFGHMGRKDQVKYLCCVDCKHRGTHHLRQRGLKQKDCCLELVRHSWLVVTGAVYANQMLRESGMKKSPRQNNTQQFPLSTDIHLLLWWEVPHDWELWSSKHWDCSDLERHLRMCEYVFILCEFLSTFLFLPLNFICLKSDPQQLPTHETRFKEWKTVSLVCFGVLNQLFVSR